MTDEEKLLKGKQDLVTTLKMIYSILGEEKEEILTLIKYFCSRMDEKDKLLNIILNERE